ncbi:DNA cytosine methyltransferase [Enterococcus cecorum]|uniref:DNA cytosine methyltransferase n=1 Tax=Enterococcus cecorum TaxID=44008 RepID=UPI000DEAA98C|nr:DNA cytosine methyltransferase [Enterococcus cecorum]RBR36052.1 hypothetical protein EB26_00874 [Enterococcus cecorum]
MIRVFEAFAGVGSQRMALRNIGIEHEVVAIAEIDKYAIKSYEAIHGKVNNLGDISKIETNTIPDHDLFTYSFPCQDISTAGLRKGFKENSGTRSSLLWECRKVIEVKKPKWLLMENVKNLVGKKFKKDFDAWCEWLESQGYTNYWQVLNAKDYGIPQNRERVFMISILGVHEPYVFPEKQELHIRLKDVLDKEVDSKFYLKEAKVKQLLDNVNGNIDLNKKRIGTVHKNNDMTRSTRDIVFNDLFESPCLTATMHKDAPKILESADGIYLNASKKIQHGSLKDLSRTLKANNHDAGVVINELPIIRKLTPRECWRLMGFDDSDFEKAEQVNSNTQLYKQAGNSIVVNVLEAIFSEMFTKEEKKIYQTDIFDFFEAGEVND